MQIAVGWVYVLARNKVFHVLPHGPWWRRGTALKREDAEAAGLRPCESGCYP